MNSAISYTRAHVLIRGTFTVRHAAQINSAARSELVEVIGTAAFVCMEVLANRVYLLHCVESRDHPPTLEMDKTGTTSVDR